jgi:hypothetical protein
MNITPSDVLMWVESNPKRYYKEGQIYGLISTFEGEDGILYVAGMVEHIDASFTKDMIKDIILLGKTRIICLITDVESKHELLYKALTKWRTSVEYKNGNMYTFCTSKGR